jgi:hypothetical protein
MNSHKSENPLLTKNMQIDYGEYNPDAPIETKQFGQLVGVWSCISEDLMPDSTFYQSRATWIFKYILDGYAIEDIWSEKKEDKTNNTLRIGRDFKGKNIRMYNLQIKKWQCVWLENRTNTIFPVWEAEYKNDEIVMHDGSGTWEIVFFNLTRNSFDWKYWTKNQDEWSIVSKIQCSRL